MKDFAGLNRRFRPPRRVPPRESGGAPYSFRPTSVQNQKVFNHRVQGWFRRSFPRFAAYALGGVLLLIGGLNTGGILTLQRGSQVSLVNNLILVFAGFFLVFLANHEKAVEKGSRP